MVLFSGEDNLSVRPTADIARQASMIWAQSLKLVLDIDIETCSECGGDVKIIASIAEVHLKQNCSKDFKPIHTTLLLHRIMRQGYLRACGRNWYESQ